MNKIFIIANNSWNLFNFRSELINKLSSKYKIYLFCNNDIYTKKLIFNSNIKVIEAHFKKNNFNIFKDILLFFKILFYSIKIKPTYILAFTLKPNFYALLVAFFINVKVVNNITGLGSVFLKNNFLKYILLKFYSFLLKKSFYIFFQNNFDKHQICNNQVNLLNKSIIIPGSGINLNKFNYDELQPTNLNFIFIGRIIKDKGILELFEAIKKIKINYDINFKIIGDIDSTNPSRISNEALEYWINLNIFEYKNKQDNVINLLKNCQCLILPSYREGASRVIMEAMAVGRPVIASDVPGCNNLIDHNGNGFLFKSNNVDSLYKAILKVYNLSYRDKLLMGKTGRDKVEKEYSVQFVVDKYLEIL